MIEDEDELHAADAAAAFSKEMEGVRRALADAAADAGGLSRSLGTGLRRAFEDLVFDGARLSDTLKGLGRSIATTAFRQAFQPVQQALATGVTGGVSSLIQSFLPFAKGGAISQGRVMAFAKGGVVDGPTLFPMKGATGLMGEAGPEAIMPLTRGPDGSLGVRAEGGRPVTVNMTVQAADAQSFRKNRTQIAAELSRAMGRAGRNR